MKFIQLTLVFLFLFGGANVFAQSDDLFLGIKLRPEVQALVKEIEKKTGMEIYAEFIDEEEFTLGSSRISNGGQAVIQVDTSLAGNPKKLEAVIAHELLHMRLRAGGYPTFLFSPTIKTAKGLAQDVEQDNVNSLASMIEHRIFKADMIKFGLYDANDLAGDIAREARKYRGKADAQGQGASIDYALAILEYQNPKDIEEVRKIYEANNWKRSLQEGKAIADIISQANMQTPKDAENVFLQCLSILYTKPNSPFTFKLTPDPSVKVYRQLIIHTAKLNPKKQSQKL
ncbi:MAG: hypothetical protein M3033_14145 [Acidobacteriota bacterium]|nr:hypothetical protein [Acidobacteriota bacterium]